MNPAPPVRAPAAWTVQFEELLTGPEVPPSAGAASTQPRRLVPASVVQRSVWHWPLLPLARVHASPAFFPEQGDAVAVSLAPHGPTGAGGVGLGPGPMSALAALETERVATTRHESVNLRIP